MRLHNQLIGRPEAGTRCGVCGGGSRSLPHVNEGILGGAAAPPQNTIIVYCLGSYLVASFKLRVTPLEVSVNLPLITVNNYIWQMHLCLSYIGDASTNCDLI